MRDKRLLTLTVRLTQNVNVVNSTMQVKAFIEIQGGSVVLNNVDFEDFHTIEAAALFV